ncbi:hypothetical protein [Kutzneria kofuensis]|uniref:hypothetical protein n=1 Tax=Kutzneria kofuensis TaxID=103725 RepID=UPI0031E656A6
MDVDTLRGIALFAALTASSWRGSRRPAHSIRWRTATCCFRDGERADAFYVLVDGELAFSARDASGREQFPDPTRAPRELPSSGGPRPTMTANPGRRTSSPGSCRCSPTPTTWRPQSP